MLGPMVDERPIRERWLIVRGELDERGRRMWAAAEARSHGRGGIAAVVRATGISEATVRRGIAEVDSGQRAPEGRVRRPGGGASLDQRARAGAEGGAVGVAGGRYAWGSAVAAVVDQPQRRELDRSVALAGVRRAREHGAPAAEGSGVQLAGQPQGA